MSSDAIEYISTSQQSTEQTLSYVTESAHKAGTVSSDSKLSSTISTVVTTINGTSTVYTTWCPLTSDFETPSQSITGASSSPIEISSHTGDIPPTVSSASSTTISRPVSVPSSIVSTVVTTINGTSTVYTTWCPLTYESATPSPSVTGTSSNSDEISSHTEGTSEIASSISSETISQPVFNPSSVISTVVTTINGTSTVYTTWCPLSSEIKASSYVKSGSTSINTSPGPSTISSRIESTSKTLPSVISETGQSVTLSEVGSTSSASVAGSSHTTPPTATLSYISSSAASTSIITSWKTVTISTEVCVDNACSQSAYVTTTPHAITLYSTIVSTNGWGNSSSQYARNSSSYISVATRPSASLNVSSLTVGTTRATANVSTIESTVNGTITTYTTWCPFSSINKTPAEVSGSLSTYSLTSTTTSVICPSCRAGNSNTSRTVPSTKTPAPSANGSTDDSSIVSSSSTSIDASSRTAETVFGSEVTRTMSSLGTTTISVQSCSEENCTTSRSSITSAALTTSPIEDYPSSTKYPSINKVASPSATSSATGHDTSSNSLQVFSAGVSKLVQSKALTIFGILVCLI